MPAPRAQSWIQRVLLELSQGSSRPQTRSGHTMLMLPSRGCPQERPGTAAVLWPGADNGASDPGRSLHVPLSQACVWAASPQGHPPSFSLGDQGLPG